MKDHRVEALHEIEACICKNRQATYGSPEDNFSNIAKLASVVLRRNFSSVDVALFMSCVKLARLAASPTFRDNWIDLAGYAVCGVSIVEGERDKAADTA